LAIDAAKYYRLNKSKANKIIELIKAKVKDWKRIADKYHLPKSEQSIMEKAFRA